MTIMLHHRAKLNQRQVISKSFSAVSGGNRVVSCSQGGPTSAFRHRRLGAEWPTLRAHSRRFIGNVHHSLPIEVLIRQRIKSYPRIQISARTINRYGTPNL